MRIRRSGRALLAVAGLLPVLAAGCGSAFLPERTTKPVSVADVAGQWQYYDDGTLTTVIVTMKEDKTFAQVSVDNTGKMTSTSGTWALNGADVSIAGFLPPAGGGCVNVTWWVTDDRETPSGFGLFGGDTRDPDAGAPMKKIWPTKEHPAKSAPPSAAAR